MVEARDGPGLALESGTRLRLRCKRMQQDFDGDDAAETDVAGLVDRSHATGADGFENLEGT
jgi:hypothetical protein